MKKFLKGIALFILAIAVLFVHSNFTVGTSSYEVNIEYLPQSFDGFKIAVLSDLHNKQIASLPDKIADAEPDIVVMTGDMVNSDDENFDTFLNLAEKIAGEYPTYFVVGNHEQALNQADYNELMARIAACGVFVLDNERTGIERDGEVINLFGLWFNLRYYRDLNDGEEYDLTVKNIRKILGSSGSGINILLTHNPVYFDAYDEWGADLTISGHMHGGMIRIPFQGGLFSPEKEYFPEYDGGLYEKEGSSLVVSRGLGEHAGFRFFNQPEILVITLKK